MNLLSAGVDQLPILSSTILIKNLDLCKFYKEKKMNRFFFFTYYISYPQGPGFSLNYFQTVKPAALFCASWARNTKLDCSWSFQATLRAVLLFPECHFGTHSGLLCVINLLWLFSQTVPLPPFSPQGSVHSDPQCLGSWIPKLKDKGNVTKVLYIWSW